MWLYYSSRSSDGEGLPTRPGLPATCHLGSGLLCYSPHWRDAHSMFLFLSKAALREMNSTLAPGENDVQQLSAKPTVNKRLGEWIQLEEN